MSAPAVPQLKARSRWSAAAKCPRWAAMGGLGYEPSEPSERTQRIFHRGKLFGWFVASQFEQQHGEAGIVREKPVAWPGGELHTDVFVKPEKLAVEVKSSTSPRSLIEDGMLQLAGEVHFDPEAEAGVLVLVDPVDLGEEFLPLVLTDEWVDRVEERANLVVRALQTRGDDMPACVCALPGQCRAKGCPFTAQAWEGFTLPEPFELPQEVLPVVAEFDRLQQAERQAGREKTSLERQRKTAQDAVAALELQPGVVYRVGPYQVKRIHVDGGHVEYDRKAYDRFDAKRTEGDTPVAVEDFGEDPPF